MNTTSVGSVFVENCAVCGIIKICGEACSTCAFIRGHRPDCRFVRSATCPVAIECEHDRDVCPICDACDCLVFVHFAAQRAGIGWSAGDFR